MRTQVIIIDIFNKKHLQYIDFKSGDIQWTSELTQCSFYEEENIPKIMQCIDTWSADEHWIEAKIIFVKD